MVLVVSPQANLVPRASHLTHFLRETAWGRGCPQARPRYFKKDNPNIRQLVNVGQVYRSSIGRTSYFRFLQYEN